MINRRDFINKSIQTTAALSVASSGKVFPTPYIKNKNVAGKVFVLGFDGMDPRLLQKFVAKGEMPAFRKMVKEHNFQNLQTTLPPQSPVAWSSFITGSNPGVHGIFDFIHRDPKAFEPYLSTTRTTKNNKNINLGEWQIPLGGGKVELLRAGTPFWSILENHGIPTTLYKLPANYPVAPNSSRVISGMSTPDLLGTYGTFTYFSDLEISNASELSGGRFVKIDIHDHVVRSYLEGPANPYKQSGEPTKIPFTVYRDPQNEATKISLQNHEILLKKGEWSEWLPLKFELLPLFSTIHGMVRIYVQQVHPHIRLYMSPINIDPENSQVPLSNPTNYSSELSKALGRFYTQGFPEDTKALSNNIFSSEEFLQQSTMVLEERLKAFQYELNHFNEGLFFFYFSSLDQNSHMLLRMLDKNHPLYEPNASEFVKNSIYMIYQKMDDVLAQTMAKMKSNDSLIILSDHGFAPFTREFNLSTWLVEKGFTAVSDHEKYHQSEFYDYVYWQNTSAFAMGLNSIYLNVQGREKYGSVNPNKATKIKKDLIAKLNAVVDPVTGSKVLVNAYDTAEIYHGEKMPTAPDIVLGYQQPYRISDEATLGKFPKTVFSDRVDKWSADHCIDSSVVPGVLLTSFDTNRTNPGIWDLAPTIIKSFGLEPPSNMDGRSLI